MTNAKRPPKRWSYSTGERGANRVRAFEHAATGRLFLEYYEPTRTGERPKVCRVALGRIEPDQAKAAADRLAAELRTAEGSARETITLGKLFDIYVREVTPEKGATKQKHDKMCAELFRRAFGSVTDPRTLSRREWDRFIRERRSGVLRPASVKKSRTVGNRMIAYDLQWLQAVLNWATMSSNGHGGVLLERNPLKGLELPREAAPRRVVVSDEEYQKIRAKAGEVNPLFELALVLAHDTGHRLSSIRQLRWSDVDRDAKMIRWRAENDKIHFEHETPLTDEAVRLLSRAQDAACAIGDALLFPDPKDPTKPRPRYVFIDWWKQAERRAKLAPVARRGWHSLRRKFATELKHISLKDLCELGGWKEPTTVLTCYIKPDQATMRAALEQRVPLAAAVAR